jgi:pyroglutamyl-peptidase
MKLLLTGFEPFNGSPCNPSEQVAHTLDGQVIGGMRISTAILPVDLQRSPRQLLDLLEALRPEAVICLGEATGRALISVERLAVNLLDFRIPDNAGNMVLDQPVVPGGPDAYFVTLPVRKVHEAIRGSGAPCEISLSAGTYLCNQVLYHLLHALHQQGRKIPAGFIHLPALPQQVVSKAAYCPSMSLDTMLSGLRAGIAAL